MEAFKCNLGCDDLTESNNHLCFMLSIWESLVLVINSAQVIMPLEVLVQYFFNINNHHKHVNCLIISNL